MNIENYTNFLLSSLPNARLVSGGKEILTRCQYCPDSKDKRHGHFYISIPQNENEPSLFNCYKCHSSGVVTNKTLLEWGIYDYNVGIDIINHNKKIMSNPKNFYMNNNIKYNIKYTNITIDDLSKYKLDYINKRLGLNLSFDDCIRFKIVLNLNDIIFENNLKYTRDGRVVELLDNSFIGFLSSNNAFLNMRRIVEKELPFGLNKRYVNYNLFNKIDNTHRFYIIPTNIDLLQPINLHISEGPFDTLGIYFNLRNCINDNSVYSNIGGSGYKGIIKYFINTLKIPNININIYPDSDIDNYILYDILKFIEPFDINCNFIRNEIGKDFGVRKDQMKPIKIIL